MPWTLRDAKRDQRIIENIEKADDRSAAILAAAFLEDRLTIAIKARLTPDTKVQGAFFKGYGPLAGFSAKIDLAYLIGILHKETRDGFHVIRDIRNRFAHRLDAADFYSPLISDLCEKLFRPDTIKWMRDQTKTEMEKLYPGSDTAAIFFVIDPLAELPDTPRNAYMSTIKLNVLVMELGTQFAHQDRGDAVEPLVLAQPSPWLEKSVQPLPRSPRSADHAPKKRVRRRRSSPP